MSGRMRGPSMVLCSTGINSRSTKSATVFFNIRKSSGRSKSITARPSDYRCFARDCARVIAELGEDLAGMLAKDGSGTVGSVPAAVDAHRTPDCDDFALLGMAQDAKGFEVLDLGIVDHVGDVVDRCTAHPLFQAPLPTRHAVW